MKTRKSLNRKIAMAVASFGVVASIVYALNATPGIKDRCYRCDDEHPVTIGNTVCKSQDCCCIAVCLLLNPDNHEAAGHCTADCMDYRPKG